MRLPVKAHVRDVWSASVSTEFVALPGTLMSFPLRTKKRAFALQETGWLTGRVGAVVKQV